MDERAALSRPLRFSMKAAARWIVAEAYSTFPSGMM
jgi:hypothetical protein